MDGDGFVTQGDNNDWLDEDHPSQDEILGRLFLRIPQGGKALDALALARTAPPRRGRIALAVLGAVRTARARRARPARTADAAPRVAAVRLLARPRGRAPARSRSARRRRARRAAVGGGVLLRPAVHPDRDRAPWR